jgi:hypothetical protein
MNGKVRHDLKCTNCNMVERDVYVDRNSIVNGGVDDLCPHCNTHGRSIYFGNWEDIQVFNDGMGGMFGYQRTDKKGRVREFGVMDDTLSKIQLGMYTRPTDKGLKNFTDDQTAAFREKLASQGDSGKLRKEIIEQYETNKRNGL